MFVIFRGNIAGWDTYWDHKVVPRLSAVILRHFGGTGNVERWEAISIQEPSKSEVGKIA